MHRFYSFRVDKKFRPGGRSGDKTIAAGAGANDACIRFDVLRDGGFEVRIV